MYIELLQGLGGMKWQTKLKNRDSSCWNSRVPTKVTAIFNFTLQGGELRNLEAREEWVLKFGQDDTGVEIKYFFADVVEEKSLWRTLQYNSQFSV